VHNVVFMKSFCGPGDVTLFFILHDAFAHAIFSASNSAGVMVSMPSAFAS
jgi:hypothetical protein